MTNRRIIEASIQLFRLYGIKSVSMDCIVKELGISKRTIYEHFGSKSSLIQSCVEYQIEQEQLLRSGNDNLLDDLLQCCALFEDRCGRHLSDIHKFYADTYFYIKQQIEQYAEMCGKKTKSGIETEYIRSDITPEFVSNLIKQFLLNRIFCKGCFMNNNEVSHSLLFQVMIRGISTPRGCAYIESKKLI